MIFDDEVVVTIHFPSAINDHNSRQRPVSSEFGGLLCKNEVLQVARIILASRSLHRLVMFDLIEVAIIRGRILTFVEKNE